MTRRARTYHYIAYTRAGALAEGRLQATSLDDAIEMLWERGLTPFETREHAAPASGRWWQREILTPHKPSRRDVAYFTREFATLARSDIPLDDALRIVLEQSSTTRMRRVIQGLLEAVLDGADLSDAMARHPEAFQEDYVNMVHAGEMSGDMAGVFSELADLLERRLDLAGRLTSALVYPSVLILVALASIAAVIGVLVPSLAPIFAEGGKPMPATIALLVRIREAWPLILTAGAVMGVVALGLGVTILQSNHLRRAADRILLGLPLVGTLSAEQNFARFSRTLGSLLRTGVPILAALTSARSAIRNRHIDSGLAASLETVRDGQSLGRALSRRPGIPRVALRMITVGEETGKLDEMLLRTAIVLEQQSQRRIERLMTLLTPALTMAMAGVIGGLMLTVMNAIFSANEVALQ
jgi:general secretion pathway protein F